MTFSKPRGLVSNGLITFFFGAFAGLLWIGRGRVAVLWALFCVAVILLASVYGLPLLPEHIHGDVLVDRFWLVLGLSSVSLVWRWRLGRIGRKWYAHGAVVALLGIALPILLSTACDTWLVEAFATHGNNMQPSLIKGDSYIVLKDGFFDVRPSVGSIVEIRIDDYFGTSVGRIVGKGGDAMQMVHGVLQINGVAVLLTDVGACDCPGLPPVARLQRETLPNGVSYNVVNFAEGFPGDDTELFVVPADHYFILGDNRDESSDSRFALGFVKSENIIGQAVRVFWNSEGKDFHARQSLIPDLE